MLGTPQHHNIPLPKGWPRRVRSAVIQVVSLAHFSLITTRSWAADSWDSYPAGTTFAGAGLSPVGTTSLCTAHLVHYSRAAREEVWTFGYDTVDSPRCKTFETRWLIDDPSIDPMVLSMEATNKSLGQQPVIDRKPS